MTEEQMAIELATHDHQLKSVEKRIQRLEENQTQINNLTISVRELALSIKQMSDEQDEQSSRLQRLEEAGSEKWNNLTKTIVSCITSGIVGIIIGAIVKFI